MYWLIDSLAVKPLRGRSPFFSSYFENLLPILVGNLFIFHIIQSQLSIHQVTMYIKIGNSILDVHLVLEIYFVYILLLYVYIDGVQIYFNHRIACSQLNIYYVGGHILGNPFLEYIYRTLGGRHYFYLTPLSYVLCSIKKGIFYYPLFPYAYYIVLSLRIVHKLNNRIPNYSFIQDGLVYLSSRKANMANGILRQNQNKKDLAQYLSAP